MRTAYRVLAYAIAALVAVQAAAIGYGVFAQLNWIENGGTLDKATLEASAPGSGALIFHALEGWRRTSRGTRAVDRLVLREDSAGRQVGSDRLGLHFVQIALGTLSHLVTASGAVHGAFALVLFGVAVMAAMRARKPAAVEEPSPAKVA